MAPEQARRSTDAVPQSDVYSLGVILYEILTGSVPFDDPSPTTVALQHMTLPPTPPRSLNPRLSEAVEAVLLKALSKDPAARYPTGRALMDALEASLQLPAPADGLSAQVPLPAAGPLPISDVPVDVRVASAPEGVAGVRAIPDTQPRQPQPARAARRSLPLGALAVGLALAGLLCLVLAVLPRLRPAAGTGTSTGTDGSGATSTVAFPGGRPFVALYDDNSFYLLNLAQGDSPIAPIAFERLNAEGLPVERFDGERWAEFYPTLNPGACMRIEILDSPPYRQPPECFSGYLSTRTPLRSDPVIFWTAREGSQQFRVLWDEQEVGRCEIAAGLCRVYLP
jgi:hypothetical protein